MFNFREFIKSGFLGAIGHQPDYWIILNAGGYANQGVLTMEDLAEIQTAIEAQYIVEEEPEVPDEKIFEEPVEDLVEETNEGIIEEIPDEETENQN